MPVTPCSYLLPRQPVGAGRRIECPGVGAPGLFYTLMWLKIFWAAARILRSDCATNDDAEEKTS